MLRGITWAHTRGFAPLAALGRVWEDHHPGERVTWDARSLRSFGEEPLEAYVDDYDLIVFDYPFAGEALARGWLLPLETLLPPETLAARQAGTIGPAFTSFLCDGRLAAVPIDVATHVAVSRPDLLEAVGRPLPDDWDATVDLARATGKVAMPMRPTGIWGAFLTLCANAGDRPFQRDDGRPFDTDVAHKALTKLGQLAAEVDPSCAEAYPVALLNRMATTDAIAFMPCTYGYCTYGLAGYARHRLRFHDLRLGTGSVAGAVLGGAGIGISARSRNPDAAAVHLSWLTSPAIQRTLYVLAGGQPAQYEAWRDETADALTNGFFSGTIRSAEAAYMRPNRRGFHHFQNLAAERLHRAVLAREEPVVALAEVAMAWNAVGRGE